MVDELQPAFRSYAAVDPAAPEGDALNLAWTRDERACLAVDLSALLAGELRAEAEDLRALDRYLVRDPYGEATLGPAVVTAFGLPAWEGHVTCGAGVVSLLHGFARLAPAVRILGDVYPDLPYWIAQAGGRCRDDAGVWFLERPGLIGDAFASLDELAATCAAAARAGAIVIVDEANASYAPPTWSAVTLVPAHANLVVARGFSKAYGLGALRLAYCVAQPALTERIRTVIPPLLASSLSLVLGARVLGLGDIAAPLRARIAAHRGDVVGLFARAGIEVRAASEYLPYVLAEASPPREASIEARGIIGKRHPQWSAGRVTTVYRLSIPLADARLARLRELLA